jgi:hypothetical protein
MTQTWPEMWMAEKSTSDIIFSLDESLITLPS